MFSINGFALHSPANGRWLVSPTQTVTASQGWSGVQTTIPGVHGSRFSSVSKDTPTLDIVVFCTAAAAPVVEAAFSIRNGLLQRTGADAVFQLQELKKETMEWGASKTAATYRITATLAFPETSWRLAEVTVPVPEGGTSTLAVGGDAPVVDSLIRFQGVSAGARVADSTSGTRVQLSQGYTGYVLVDTDQQRAWHLGASDSWSPGGTEVSNSLIIGTPPYALDMRAVPSGNTVAYRPTVVLPGGTGSVQMRFRPRVSI